MNLKTKIFIIVGFCIIISASLIVILTKMFDKIEDQLLQKYMQKFEDEFLKDEDVVFSILLDKNGYAPTHNSKYSLPAEKDFQKNLLYSRSKRIFSDKPEIREVLLYRGKGTLKYPYHRDTGEVMWNIGAPISLQGKHWGTFLIGISLQRLDIIKNQMIIIIVTIMVINLSFTLLVILAVIPRKYLMPPPSEKSADTHI
jgi:hypothetical protein